MPGKEDVKVKQQKVWHFTVNERVFHAFEYGGYVHLAFDNTLSGIRYETLDDAIDAARSFLNPKVTVKSWFDDTVPKELRPVGG